MSDIIDITDSEVATARWRATIYYRSELGEIDVEHGVEEIEDLHDIVERGPDWNTIVRIEITLDRITSEELTLEDGSKQ